VAFDKKQLESKLRSEERKARAMKILFRASKVATEHEKMDEMGRNGTLCKTMDEMWDEFSRCLTFADEFREIENILMDMHRERDEIRKRIWGRK
jgi:hypothetical protein